MSSIAEAEQDFIDIIICMVASYDQQIQNDSPKLSPEEFVKKNFCEKELFLNNMQEKCVTAFFEICSLRAFLEEFIKDDILPSTPAGLVHVYILIFYVSPSNIEEIIRGLTHHFDLETIKRALKYMTANDLVDIIVKNSSKLPLSVNQQDVAKNIKEKMELYQRIEECINYLKESSKSPRCHSVCGVDFEQAHQLLLDYNDNPETFKLDLEGSVWSPRNTKSSTSCSVKMRSADTTVRSKTFTSKSKKFSADLKLLPLDQQPEVKKIRELKRIDEEQFTTLNSAISTSRRSKGAPEIKKTTAQVLREGARLQKKREEGEKLIKELCNGSVDPFISRKLLHEVRQEENAMEVREIERKHLLGLLSREEAKIAKSAVLKANRMKALELKQQSQELEKQLQEWRRMEMMRMREIAERNQSSMEQARLAQATLLDKRRRTAKQIQEESRQLQKRIEQQRKQELDQKISLIRQIKELEHLSKSARDMGPNYSDNRSQTASIGVSCQMSIIQLKEALAQVKSSIQQQVQERREKIQFEHMRQHRLLQDTMQQIERNKNVSKLKKPKALNQKELVLTPDLIKLRKKLELKRLQAASAGRF